MTYDSSSNSSNTAASSTSTSTTAPATTPTTTPAAASTTSAAASTTSTAASTTSTAASTTSTAASGTFTVNARNVFDESHVLNVEGQDIPYRSQDSGDTGVNFNFEAGATVTAYVRYRSADFTSMGWTLDSFGIGYVGIADGNIGPDMVIRDTNGNPFSSIISSTYTVAGDITENRVQFIMPLYSFTLMPIVASSSGIGISPETRIDLNTIEEIEFDGNIISNLYIDGVLYWDSSLPAGGKFTDATAGTTFLVADE